jgi:hypothetical protein
MGVERGVIELDGVFVNGVTTGFEDVDFGGLQICVGNFFRVEDGLGPVAEEVVIVAST